MNYFETILNTNSNGNLIFRLIYDERVLVETKIRLFIQTANCSNVKITKFLSQLTDEYAEIID